MSDTDRPDEPNPEVAPSSARSAHGRPPLKRATGLDDLLNVLVPPGPSADLRAGLEAMDPGSGFSAATKNAVEKRRFPWLKAPVLWPAAVAAMALAGLFLWLSPPGQDVALRTPSGDVHELARQEALIGDLPMADEGQLPFPSAAIEDLLPLVDRSPILVEQPVEGNEVQFLDGISLI